MAIAKSPIRYLVGGKAHEGLAVWDDAAPTPRPLVLVAPTFMDRSAFEEEKAEKLAALGYAALVVDLFGVDVQPANADEAAAAMQGLNADRAALAAMMQAALAAGLGLDGVDADRMAAIGFCFGGKCVLDLARQGVALKGVVSFHGIFDAPDIAMADTIPAKILALHGWDDPLAAPEAVLAFTAEMTAKAADWQLHAYGHTQHGFTNYNRPAMFSEEAARRSWEAMAAFLTEVLD